LEKLKRSKPGCRHGSGGRATAQQAQGHKFNPQYYQKKKKKGLRSFYQIKFSRKVYKFRKRNPM
jgi:hypothetical protein